MREAQRMRHLKAATAEELVEKKKRDKDTKRLRKAVRGGTYAERLQQAGLYVPPVVWVSTVLCVSVLMAIGLTNAIGPLVGFAVAPCFGYYYLSTYLTARAEKRRRQGVPLLPGFLDTLSASLGTGYNMEVAVEHATNSLPEGMLKTEFTRVVRMMNKGMMMNEALEYMVRRISGQEIVSIVITIRLFADMGGRGLEPFRRLGYKMREQQSVLERAGRDLVGTKQAFYVIFSLSICAPIFLLASQPSYILAAFEHEWIKYIMQGAIVVQVMCFMLFKRFTTLRI
jgi:Flp pilus assembly protein TadB